MTLQQTRASGPMPTTRYEQSTYDHDDPAFALHEGGKLATVSTVPLRDKDDLSLAYTPGVARVCTAIAEHPDLVHDLTWKSNVVAVVTDGSAVLGLGDIGPAASLPVMEGKAVLFKQFGGVDAVPICLDTTDVDEIVETVTRIAPGFGGINLEDISAPRCFEVERRLDERLDIPVFHDDQHGTAVVALAALRNAAVLTGRGLSDLRVVVSGAGAAGVAVTTILIEAGIGEITVADRGGVLHLGRADLTTVKSRLASITNEDGRTGSLVDAMHGADVFIGVSGGTVPEDAVAAMADGRDRLRPCEPPPRGRPGGGGPPRGRGRDGSQRLPQPDKQRARLPGHLPRGTRRPGHLDHRGDEAGRRRGARRGGVGRAGGGPDRAEPVRPPGRSGGVRGSGGGRPPGRRRPALTGPRRPAHPNGCGWVRRVRCMGSGRRRPPSLGRSWCGRWSSCRVPRPRSAARMGSSSWASDTRCIAYERHDISRSSEVKMYRERKNAVGRRLSACAPRQSC